MSQYTVDPWNESTTIRAAQAYGRLGLRVLPVSMSEKRAVIHRDDCPAYQAIAPLAPWQEPGKGSQHTAHCSPHAIAAVFVPYLPCRIGYAPPPGVIIIDVDNGSLRLKHPALWTELETSDTFVVKTHRGFHFYFEGEGLNQTTAAGLSTLPDDHPLRCVDVKVGAKGIVILPPSPPYTHLRGRPDRLAPLPAAMMAEFSARPAGRPRRAPTAVVVPVG